MLAHYSFAILQLVELFHHYHRSMTQGGLFGQPDRMVYGAFACFDCCCAGSADGCSGPGAGFLLSSSGERCVSGCRPGDITDVDPAPSQLLPVGCR